MENQNKALIDLSEAQRSLSVGEIIADVWDSCRMVGFHILMNENCRLDLLEKCWNRVVETNDALRIRIVRGFKRKQYFEPFAYETYDTVRVNGEDGFMQLEEEERAKPVKMYGKLYRVSFVDCGNGTGGMIAMLHNICCDGYTLGMIFEQMEELYALAVKGEEFPEVKQYSYAEYVKLDKKYKESGAYKKDRIWWKQKIRSLKNYSIPVGFPSLKKESGMIISSVNADAYDKLDAITKKAGIPITAGILSVMALTTYKLTGKKCFCFLNLSHGRRTYAMKQTAGCMVKDNFCFFDIENCTVVEMLKKDYMEYLECLQHGNFSIETVILYMMKQTLKNFGKYNHYWMNFSVMELGSLEEESEIGMKVFDEKTLDNHFYCAVYNIPQKRKVCLELNYLKNRYGSKAEHIKKVFEETLEWCMSNPDRKIEEYIRQVI